jgi:hypothetical protein
MNIPCAAVTTPLEMMDTAVRGLASWRLAESAIADIVANILCAAVMAQLEIVDATRRRGDNDWPVPSVS